MEGQFYEGGAWHQDRLLDDVIGQPGMGMGGHAPGQNQPVAVPLADTDGLVLTGRVSTHTHAWLADHIVEETILVPGTAFVELALHAGDQVNSRRIDELTLHTPLVLPAQTAIQ